MVHKLYETNTFSMIFTRSPVAEQVPLFLNDIRVKDTEWHKHLGIALTSDCSRTNHLEDVYVTAMKRVECLRGMKYMFDRKQLETFYFVFIRPILEHGDIRWENCSQACSYALERVQLAAARVGTGATLNWSIRLLYE